MRPPLYTDFAKSHGSGKLIKDMLLLVKTRHAWSVWQGPRHFLGGSFRGQSGPIIHLGIVIRGEKCGLKHLQPQEVFSHLLGPNVPGFPASQESEVIFRFSGQLNGSSWWMDPISGLWILTFNSKNESYLELAVDVVSS